MQKKLGGLAALISIAAACSAMASRLPVDPETSLADLNKWYSAEIKRLRDEKKTADLPALMKDRTQKAKDAVKDVDLATVEPAKSLALAQLYQAAQMPKEMVAAATKFVGSNPDAEKKYQAQQLLLGGYNQLKDVEAIRTLLNEMKPTTPSAAAILAMNTSSIYAPMVAQKFGADTGLALIAKMEAQVPFEQLQKEEAEKAKATPQTPGAAAPFSIAESAIASIATGKATLLQEAGKNADAMYTLEQAVKRLGPDSRQTKSLESKLNLAKLPGSTAPALTVERKYGEFTDLAAYRGKVIVLDFFAHWCGPCKRGNPSMKKMYDDLHSKGLEIVSVTRYYGYYGADKGLTPDAEFGKMEAYKNEENMSWPMVFGKDNENFTAYGVSGIPHYVVIDQQGKVNSITVGFSEGLHSQLRSKVEKLLNVSANR